MKENETKTNENENSNHNGDSNQIKDFEPVGLNEMMNLMTDQLMGPENDEMLQMNEMPGIEAIEQMNPEEEMNHNKTENITNENISANHDDENTNNENKNTEISNTENFANENDNTEISNTGNIDNENDLPQEEQIAAPDDDFIDDFEDENDVKKQVLELDEANDFIDDYPNDENQSIDMPKETPDIEIDDIEKNPDRGTAPEYDQNQDPQIHVDFDEVQDTVNYYGNDDEKPAKVRNNFKLASDLSLNDLPPLTTSPELDLQLSTLLRNFEKKGKIPEEVEMRPRLVQYLQREKVNNIVRQKYDIAQKYHNLTNKLLTVMTKNAKKVEFSQKVTSVEEKVDETEARIKELNRETKSLIREEKEKQNKRRLAIKVNHSTELEEFEAKWNDPEYLRIFEKPSSRLLQLKKMERSMVLSKMYDKAAVVHQKIKEAEKAESSESQLRAIFEMKKQQKKILMKQKQELDVFEQHCERNINLIQRNQEIKMKSILSRKTKLETEMGMIKDGHKNSLPVIGVMPPTPNGKIESSMTPRTAQRYSSFKAINKGPHISVKPLGNLFPKKLLRLARSAPATDL
ncbi:hypothetical protein TRFO_39536 [Tritrichomonas foetus]|uniref:Uncharacterized protein n=1 Tax=Tritrichomonas foetus TaxID=1144522 RepID=A0A1J4JAH4_9EUKA|nr:hypothetical protein TRFO_39536 [Tritrichomonas foetus]|eukprot:OHS94268.1 hypothetical protein TRFO_39536 [Tritrichomonas foetus]